MIKVKSPHSFPGRWYIKRGKWKIIGDDYINFINMYNDIVFGDVKSIEGKRYDINNIVERHSTRSPNCNRYRR